MGPAILIYTKKGKDRYAEVDPEDKNVLLKVKGYASPRKYFNPLFEDGDFPDSMRNTLYWNQRFRLRGDDQFDVELFAPHRGPMRLSLRGFDEKGNFRELDTVID